MELGLTASNSNE